MDERPWTLAEEVAYRINSFKALNKTISGVEELTTENILGQIDMLQKEVQKLKEDGISIWNWKSAIPKIFDVVDGLFLILREMVKKEGEKE